MSTQTNSPGTWKRGTAIRLALLLVVVVAVVAAVVWPGGSNDANAQDQATALPMPGQGFGYVLDAFTGTPIKDAKVTVDGASFLSDAAGIYTLAGLTGGEKFAVVTASGRVPTAVPFSVYKFGTTSVSVHIPPAYLVPRNAATSIPDSGGSIFDDGFGLGFASGGFDASLTGFGEHPGTPAPPDEIPMPGKSAKPRPPIIPTASGDERAFPLAVFHASFPAGVPATVEVPLAVHGTDPIGSDLALLRFDTRGVTWEREGELQVASDSAATGTLDRGGLYMVVTVGRILADALIRTADEIEVYSPLRADGTDFTLNGDFEILPGTSSDVRAPTFWIYGWREGEVNATGIQVTYPSAAPAPLTAPATAFPAGVQAQDAEPAEPAPADTKGPCPEGFKCPEDTVPCIVPASEINGCGSKINFGGVCTCCREGESCQAQVKAGKSTDEYDVSLGIEEIIRQIKAKGNKSKEDIDIKAGCYKTASS